MFFANPVQPLSTPQSDVLRRANVELEVDHRDDGWDATGVLVFATSLLSLGGSGLLLLLRVAGVWI